MAIVVRPPQLNIIWRDYMLSANTLFDLPLELCVYIANMDTEVYLRMYFCDETFRAYANKDVSFKKQIRCEEFGGFVRYRINYICYIRCDNGNFSWHMNNKKHNLNGPALIRYNNRIYNDIEYRVNGKLHRLNGPAKIHSNGYREYRINGKMHRVDGPARIHSNNSEEYWYNGVFISHSY